MKNRGGLGRGLEALLPQVEDGEEVIQAFIEDIKPNPYQPRRYFDEEKLKELMDSIREHGVLQPIVIRRAVNRGFEIVAGERRFRAAQKLGMTSLPAIVREISDKQAMEIALIENLQREDLNPVEVAEAYANVMRHFALTQEELAVRVGQSRSHVANMLRLLSLPPEIRDHVSRGDISMGHARALLSVGSVDTQKMLAQKILDDALSVRIVEQMVQRLSHVSRETKRPSIQKVKEYPGFRRYEEQLRERLGTSVRIQSGKKRGKIEIDYFSLDDLERILSLIHADVHH